MTQTTAAASGGPATQKEDPMARIKITGYVDTDNLDVEHIDVDHSSGFSAEGYAVLITDENGDGRVLRINDLEDVETEVEA